MHHDMEKHKRMMRIRRNMEEKVRQACPNCSYPMEWHKAMTCRELTEGER